MPNLGSVMPSMMRRLYISQNMKSEFKRTLKNQIRRERNKNLEMTKKFGLLFDIDGVLLRGKEPIPVAADAMKMIYKVFPIYKDVSFFFLKLFRLIKFNLGWRFHHTNGFLHKCIW